MGSRRGAATRRARPSITSSGTNRDGEDGDDFAETTAESEFELGLDKFDDLGILC